MSKFVFYSYWAMKIGGKHIVFDTLNVLYFEGFVNYTIIHFHNKKRLYARGLAYLERQIPEGFVRIHRGYLVNRSQIKHIDGFTVILNSGQILPISRRRLKNLKS